jgi:polyisoprenoid-binding protein YceI
MSTLADTRSSSSSLLPRGRWKVDPAHTTIEFRVRHAGLARVRGVFERFEGVVDVAADGTLIAHGAIDAASLATRVEARDRHLRSADFFDVEAHPLITFVTTSAGLEAGVGLVVRGAITIRGTTRAIELEGEVLGTGRDDEGAERLGLALTGRLDRRDFGLTWNTAVDGGGVLVGNRVDLALEISAVRA